MKEVLVTISGKGDNNRILVAACLGEEVMDISFNFFIY
jgi:hypothetical protein